ncbi:MAG: hypothetical protein HXY22_11940 [Alphaproteobacteria bacterium]|nr:hypothetical protein [Alphaproteobacteria bacterium]
MSEARPSLPNALNAAGSAFADHMGKLRQTLDNLFLDRSDSTSFFTSAAPFIAQLLCADAVQVFSAGGARVTRIARHIERPIEETSESVVEALVRAATEAARVVTLTQVQSANRAMLACDTGVKTEDGGHIVLIAVIGARDPASLTVAHERLEMASALLRARSTLSETARARHAADPDYTALFLPAFVTGSLRHNLRLAAVRLARLVEARQVTIAQVEAGQVRMVACGPSPAPKNQHATLSPLLIEAAESPFALTYRFGDIAISPAALGAQAELRAHLNAARGCFEGRPVVAAVSENALKPEHLAPALGAIVPLLLSRIAPGNGRLWLDGQLATLGSLGRALRQSFARST